MTIKYTTDQATQSGRHKPTLALKAVPSLCQPQTPALLKRAHDLLGQAEKRIKAQEERIAELEKLATTDELTGIKNRRGFMELFAIELDRCNRSLSSGGLFMMIDLDNFKAINDTHGHMAGDACLRLVAQTLHVGIRQMDVAARLGGDEFVLLLSSTTKCEVATRAQELARQLNNLALAWYGEEIPVRASIGLKSYRAGDKIEKIFNAADVALYADKNAVADKPFRVREGTEV